MSKLDRLNDRVAKLLTVAVQEVLELVKETVSEYQEKTARTQRENERLRRRLQELQDKQRSAVELAGTDQAVHASLDVCRTEVNFVNCKQETSITESEEEQPADDLVVTECPSPCEYDKQSKGTDFSSPTSSQNLRKDSRLDLVPLSTCFRATETEGRSGTHEQKQMKKENKYLRYGLELDVKTSTGCGFFAEQHNSNHSSQNVSLSSQKHSQATNNIDAVSDIFAQASSTSRSVLSFSPQPSVTMKEIKTEVGTDEYETCFSQRHLCDAEGSSANSDMTDVLIEPVLANSGLMFNHATPSIHKDSFMADDIYISADVEGRNHRLEGQVNGVLYRRNFSGPMGLRLIPRHLRAEKRFCCGICGRCFSHAGDFKKHKRVHTGEKPYCCTVCGKRFSQSGYLKIHQRYHTGERPYCCSQCGKRFSHSSNFRKHQQIHINHRS